MRARARSVHYLQEMLCRDKRTRIVSRLGGVTKWTSPSIFRNLTCTQTACTLTAADIAGSGPIVVTVHNTGFISATDVVMAARADGLTGTLLYSDTIGSLGPHCTAPVTLTALAPDRYMLYVQLDPANGIPENDESNNLAVRQVEAFPRVYLPWVLRSY